MRFCRACPGQPPGARLITASSAWLACGFLLSAAGCEERHPHPYDQASPSEPPSSTLVINDPEQTLHAIWSSAMADEAQMMSVLGALDAEYHVVPPQTVVIDWSDDEGKLLSGGWPPLRETLTVPLPSDDLIDDFVRASSTEVALDPSRIQLGLPVLTADPGDVEAWWCLCESAEEGRSGLLVATGVGFDETGRQALVLVQGWRIQTPNPFQWLVMLQDGPLGWEVVATKQTNLSLRWVGQ